MPARRGAGGRLPGLLHARGRAVAGAHVVQEVGQLVAAGQIQRGHGLPGREFAEVVLAVVDDQALGPRRARRLGRALERGLFVVEPGGQRQPAAEFVGAQRAGLVEPHPDRGGLLRGVAGEPDIDRVVGGAGLARDVVALERAVDARGRALGGGVVHDVVDHPGRARVDGARGFVAGLDRRGLHQDLAGTVGDAVDQVGGDAIAAVGEHAVGVGDLQRGGAAGAQRQRQHGGPARLLEAEAGEVVARVLGADGLQDADRHHVLGPIQPFAQGEHGLVAVAVVLGLPGARAGLLGGQHEGLVVDLGGRGHAALERGGIDERLDGGAGLAPRLGDAVERAAVEVEAAYHGADRAVGRRHRYQGRLQRGHVDDFPGVAVLVQVHHRAAPDAQRILGVGGQRAGHDGQRFLVVDGDDVGGGAGHGHRGGAGRQHHAGQQVVAVGRLVLHAVEDFVEGLGVLFDAVGQVDLRLRAGIGRAPGVVEHARAHRAIGGLLGLGIDSGVDVDAVRIGAVLVDAVHQLAHQLGGILAVDGEAMRRAALAAAQDDGLRARLLHLLGRQVAQRLHAAQHILLARGGARQAGQRVGARGRLGNAGQHGGLGRGDLRQRLAEIGARRGGKAV
ncbi:Uncharacterised protein [Bordetella pertussis]|nr:Uncharacterised protein [Bordetella pertussis]CPM37624.1 Uncharacterised protein [Bordetella pertussis]CPM96874.1 Uncharacterised protein [Bordetella pertussis]